MAGNFGFRGLIGLSGLDFFRSFWSNAKKDNNKYTIIVFFNARQNLLMIFVVSRQELERSGNHGCQKILYGELK
jgi:hypothetical protein